MRWRGERVDGGAALARATADVARALRDASQALELLRREAPTRPLTVAEQLAAEQLMERVAGGEGHLPLDALLYRASAAIDGLTAALAGAEEQRDAALRYTLARLREAKAAVGPTARRYERQAARVFEVAQVDPDDFAKKEAARDDLD